jgi:hypothetical protein
VFHVFKGLKILTCNLLTTNIISNSIKQPALHHQFSSSSILFIINSPHHQFSSSSILIMAHLTGRRREDEAAQAKETAQPPHYRASAVDDFEIPDESTMAQEISKALPHRNNAKDDSEVQAMSTKGTKRSRDASFSSDSNHSDTSDELIFMKRASKTLKRPVIRGKLANKKPPTLTLTPPTATYSVAFEPDHTKLPLSSPVKRRFKRLPPGSPTKMKWRNPSRTQSAILARLRKVQKRQRAE